MFGAPNAFGNFGVAPAPVAGGVKVATGGVLYGKLNDIKKAYAPYSYQPPNTRTVEYLANEAEKKTRAGHGTPQAVTIVDNDECRVEDVFYDKGDPRNAPVGMHGWEGESLNPDPENLVPKAIHGIEQLLKRYETCVTDAKKLTEDIEGPKGLQVTIALLGEGEQEQRETFDRLQRHQGELYGRMLQLLAKIEKYRMQDRPLEMDEYRFRERAEGALQQLKTQHAQLSELLNIQSQHALVRDEYVDSLGEADLEVLYAAMNRQHEGLEHVNAILERDIRDVVIVRRGLEHQHNHHHHHHHFAR